MASNANKRAAHCPMLQDAPAQAPTQGRPRDTELQPVRYADKATRRDALCDVAEGTKQWT